MLLYVVGFVSSPLACLAAPDTRRTHGRLLAQECRLRLKRPKSVFFNSFISSNLWKCDLEITQLYRTFLATPGPELS